MGRRSKQWGKRKRVELVLELGGKCVHCDLEFDEFEPCKLTIDHIYGRDWNIRKKGSDSRVSRYWREYDESLRTGVPVLQVLCVSCNSIKQAIDQRAGLMDEPEEDGELVTCSSEMHQPYDDDEDPF